MAKKLTPEEEIFLNEEIGDLLGEGEADEIAAELGITNDRWHRTADEAIAIIIEADERHRKGLTDWIISLRPRD